MGHINHFCYLLTYLLIFKVTATNVLYILFWTSSSRMSGVAVSGRCATGNYSLSVDGERDPDMLTDKVDKKWPTSCPAACMACWSDHKLFRLCAHQTKPALIFDLKCTAVAVLAKLCPLLFPTLPHLPAYIAYSPTLCQTAFSSRSQ